MKLDVTQVLKSISGDNLIDVDENNEVMPISLRYVLVNSLMVPIEKDSGPKKAEKYGLAIDIQRNDEVEVTAEQIVILKEAIGKPYGPSVVGPVYAILDGKEL